MTASKILAPCAALAATVLAADLVHAAPAEVTTTTTTTSSGTTTTTTTTEPKRIEGARNRRLRLHFDSELLGGAWVRRTSPMMGEDRDSVSIGGGLGRPSFVDDGSALVTRPVFGVGLGYLFEGNRLVVGAKGSVAFDAYGIDDDTSMLAIGGKVVPYVQWMFRPGTAVRPWVEGRAGLGGLRTVRHDPTTGRTSTRVIYPTVGAGAGVHLFPREWFSVDLGLNLDYAVPLMRTGSDGFMGASSWAKRADVVGFGVLLGVSTWF